MVIESVQKHIAKLREELQAAETYLKTLNGAPAKVSTPSVSPTAARNTAEYTQRNSGTLLGKALEKAGSKEALALEIGMKAHSVYNWILGNKPISPRRRNQLNLYLQDKNISMARGSKRMPKYNRRFDSVDINKDILDAAFQKAGSLDRLAVALDIPSSTVKSWCRNKSFSNSSDKKLREFVEAQHTSSTIFDVNS